MKRIIFTMEVTGLGNNEAEAKADAIEQLQNTIHDHVEIVSWLEARLTHALPDAPVQVSPVDGEDVDPDDAVFSWEAVADPPGSEIVGYEVVVECEEPEFTKTTALVGADVTSLTVPPEVLGQEDADECKWEVLAIEESGNQTISETEFEID